MGHELGGDPAVELLDEVADLDELAQSTHQGRDARHFRRIIAARKSWETADAELRSAVIAARKAGDSWLVIGAALGTSAEAARERFDVEAVSPRRSVERSEDQRSDQR